MVFLVKGASQPDGSVRVLAVGLDGLICVGSFGNLVCILLITVDIHVRIGVLGLRWPHAYKLVITKLLMTITKIRDIFALLIVLRNRLKFITDKTRLKFLLLYSIVEI